MWSGGGLKINLLGAALFLEGGGLLRSTSSLRSSCGGFVATAEIVRKVWVLGVLIIFWIGNGENEDEKE